MKKRGEKMRNILFCIFLIFLVGCIPASEELGIEPGVIEAVPEETVEEGLNLIDKLIPNEYKFTPMSSLTIEGKKVTVKDITPEYEVIVDVQGEERVISTTQMQEYISGLSVMLTEIKVDPTGVNTYAILKITKFELGENEHLLFYQDKITVDNKVITLADVYTDSLNSISVGVNGVYERLTKGEAKTMEGLKVTNVRTNPRATSSEKYAIVKVEIL